MSGCNGQEPIEPHVTHLLPGERELLAECHRGRVYLALCGALLPVSELQSSSCEDQCERLFTYCRECVREAVETNADAGLVGPAPGQLVAAGPVLTGNPSDPQVCLECGGGGR